MLHSTIEKITSLGSKAESILTVNWGSRRGSATRLDSFRFDIPSLLQIKLRRLDRVDYEVLCSRQVLSTTDHIRFLSHVCHN